jgi:hypothetical protein
MQALAVPRGSLPGQHVKLRSRGSRADAAWHGPEAEWSPCEGRARAAVGSNLRRLGLLGVIRYSALVFQLFLSRFFNVYGAATFAGTQLAEVETCLCSLCNVPLPVSGTSSCQLESARASAQIAIDTNTKARVPARITDRFTGAGLFHRCLKLGRRGVQGGPSYFAVLFDASSARAPFRISIMP